MRVMDDSSPATQGNVKMLKTDIQTLKKDIRRVEKKFEKLYEADDQILAVLSNIDKRLTTKVEDHEHRITRLEQVAA